MYAPMYSQQEKFWNHSYINFKISITVGLVHLLLSHCQTRYYSPACMYVEQVYQYYIAPSVGGGSKTFFAECTHWLLLQVPSLSDSHIFQSQKFLKLTFAQEHW